MKRMQEIHTHISSGTKLCHRTARRVFAAPPMARYQGEEVMPGADMTDDAALLDWFRENSGTAYHLAGSCRMGPDADAVVDAELRVRGVDGLRVVDCSVMPTVIGGNTNAPAIMMGEKIADSLLGKPTLAPAELPG